MKLVLGFALLLALFPAAYGEEGVGGVVFGATEELEGVSYSGGQFAGFTVTGTGILTAKPDNVFISLQIRSTPQISMQAAEKDIERKVDFLIRGISREFKLKKENFKIIDGDNQLEERTIKGKSDNSGESAPDTKTYQQSTSKTVVISDLGGKKRNAIIEIIDAAIKYGAVAVPSAVDMPADTSSGSVSVIGKKGKKSAATKGGSKLKIKADMKENSNQLINSHFNEETLKKLLKEAKELAFNEIKEKLTRVKTKVKFNDTDYDFNINEANSITSTEDGEVSIKTDVAVVYTRTAQKAEQAKNR
ncbi:MAG: hypothetical protein NTX32_03705 [Candidatus Firestonebacteria bacterium]|nr:hypothetical protein [Candidatus Firestonebacteria bacterium]